VSGVRRTRGGGFRDVNRRLAKMATGGLASKISSRIALRAALKVSVAAQRAYDSGVDVFGAARPLGADGAPLTLVSTRATKNQLRFVATLNQIRAVLTTPWARYLIGKYGILPNGGGAMPTAWRKMINDVARQEAGDAWEELT